MIYTMYKVFPVRYMSPELWEAFIKRCHYNMPGDMRYFYLGASEQGEEDPVDKWFIEKGAKPNETIIVEY